MAPGMVQPDPDRFKPFAYLASQNAGLYRRVMLAFVAAKRRFVVHLRSEDVLADLVHDAPAAPKAVADALAQLVEWGNLPRQRNRRARAGGEPWADLSHLMAEPTPTPPAPWFGCDDPPTALPAVAGGLCRPQREEGSRDKISGQNSAGAVPGKRRKPWISRAFL